MSYLYILPRASNALLKLLRSLQLDLKRDIKKAILFPANICYTFPLAVSLTDWEIRFADIDLDTGYISLGDVRIDEVGLVSFVIPYGNLIIQEFEEIREALYQVYKVAGTMVLWDMALVMPTPELLAYIEATIKENEFFIFSFSYGKQLEIGYGSALISPLELRYEFPEKISPSQARYYINKVDKLFKGKIRTYGSKLWLFLREHPKVRRAYESELEDEARRELEDLIEEISSGGDPVITLRDERVLTYSEIVEHKTKINELYHQLSLYLIEDLIDEGYEELVFKLLDRSPLSWRFNLRLPSRELRDRYLAEVFNEGLFASRLFPVISKFFGEARRFNNASYHWLRVVNLFNNHLIDEERAEHLMEILRRVLFESARRTGGERDEGGR